MPSTTLRQTGSMIREYDVFAQALAVPPCHATPCSMRCSRSFASRAAVYLATRAGVVSSNPAARASSSIQRKRRTLPGSGSKNRAWLNCLT